MVATMIHVEIFPNDYKSFFFIVNKRIIKYEKILYNLDATNFMMISSVNSEKVITEFQKKN